MSPGKLAPDMPVFCCSATALRARAALFLQGFPGDVSYAVKANPAPHVLATLPNPASRLGRSLARGDAGCANRLPF